jgi:hypothetical protein
VKTQCKWCRQELNGNSECYEKFQCVRNLIGRERRIVRVFWRVYFDVEQSRRRDCGCNKGSCVACCEKSHDYETRRKALDWGVGWAQTKCIPTRVYRVTVRRRAKK